MMTTHFQINFQVIVKIRFQLFRTKTVEVLNKVFSSTQSFKITHTFQSWQTKKLSQITKCAFRECAKLSCSMSMDWGLFRESWCEKYVSPDNCGHANVDVHTRSGTGQTRMYLRARPDFLSNLRHNCWPPRVIAYGRVRDGRRNVTFHYKHSLFPR